MKKTKARIISLILVVALIFTLLPDMSITALADVTPVEPKRTTSCNFIFDYDTLSSHGAKPVDSYWNGTKETNDTNPLFFDDIVFPEKPVSNDGTEFLFYRVAAYDNDTCKEDYFYNPYTEYDYDTSRINVSNDKFFFLNNNYTKYKFYPVWADGTFSPKINTDFQFLVLGETDFTYVFYKDNTYESNLPYDASGEYDNFYCLNTTGTMTTFYPAYLQLKPLLIFEESIQLSNFAIDYLGSTFGIDNPTALIASYNHSEHALTISVAETPIIFETNNYCKAPETLSVKVGDKITKPTDPSVTGYNFEGWYKDAEFKTAWDFEKDTVTSTKATHLYAKFSPMDVSVLFNANGGTVNDEAIYEAAAKYDAEYGTLPVPVREGYKFLGWAKDKAGKYMVTDKTIVKLAYDHMLYAIWEKDQTNPNPNPKPDDIVVKFDSNGGNSSADSMKIIPGENPGEMPKAEKKNVIFTGWYDKDGNKITDLSQVKEDTVLTAGWENITVVAKQKLSISENFIDAKNAYLAKRAANEGSSFNAKKVKFRYRIITDTEYLDTVSYNSIKFNKADCGKAKVNKNGLLTCKKSGLVAIKYQVREKVDGVNVWKDVEGSDVLFIAIEKAIKIKKAKTTLAVNESVSENRLVNYENAGAVGSNPNFATKSVVIQKPGVISYDETTGMFTALAPGKSKVTIMYRTIIGTKENGNPKYSTVKISFKLKVK